MPTVKTVQAPQVCRVRAKRHRPAQIALEVTPKRKALMLNQANQRQRRMQVLGIAEVAPHAAYVAVSNYSENNNHVN